MVSCRTGPLRVERPLRGFLSCVGGFGCFGPPVGRDDVLRRLRHLDGEFFDLFEQRFVVLDPEAVNQEDDSACAGDGD
jgi:hypothetical protein